MSNAAEAVNNRIYGPWIRPVNRWQGAENSIHSDAVAKRIGMRGGTIPGTVHLTHFRPILDELFGNRWYETGSISMYYTFATLDGEEVRAVVDGSRSLDRDVQFAAWVENREGKVVCKGTVAVGNPALSVPYVRSLPLENCPPDASRVLARMKPGMPIPTQNGYVVRDGGEDGAVLDPQMMYGALAMVPQKSVIQPVVGFFGATEIVLHRGPIRIGEPYTKSGSIACVGASPKTEYAWFDSSLHDEKGRLIVEMRHMTRWMKISSPLWASS